MASRIVKKTAAAAAAEHRRRRDEERRQATVADCMTRGVMFIESPQQAVCGVLHTTAKITCPDGSTFSLRWEDGGLKIHAETVHDGSLADEISMRPEAHNAVTLTAKQRK